MASNKKRRSRDLHAIAQKLRDMLAVRGGRIEAKKEK